MSKQSTLKFNWQENSPRFSDITPAANPKKPAFMLKKMLPEYVWDLVAIEDNPYSFIEVQTLLDGVTVGNYSLFDQQQVLNQKKCLDYLAKNLQTNEFVFGEAFILKLHSLAAYEEALKWGCLRDGKVGIGGTSHQPPEPEALPSLFSEGIEVIQTIQNPVERALIYYFWGAMNQFFYDGNKRTSRAVMNHILMSEGFYYLSIPGAKKDAFNKIMINFYNSKDATEGIEFFLSCYKNWD